MFQFAMAEADQTSLPVLVPGTVEFGNVLCQNPGSVRVKFSWGSVQLQPNQIWGLILDVTRQCFVGITLSAGDN